MNTTNCNPTNHNTTSTCGDITVGEALVKCWPLLSTGWNQNTEYLYKIIYHRLTASIRDVPVSQISLYEHIEPIYRRKNNSFDPFSNDDQMTNEEYLLRRLFWTIAATEGCANPFDSIAK